MRSQGDIWGEDYADKIDRGLINQYRGSGASLGLYFSALLKHLSF
jgi:hypothetical protein